MSEYKPDYDLVVRSLIFSFTLPGKKSRFISVT